MTSSEENIIRSSLLTPEQLAKDILQIDYDEKHIAHLRRHGGLPYVRLQINGQKIFRYPLEQVQKWITKRTHGANSQPEKRI
jgi:hypothetical protein